MQFFLSFKPNLFLKILLILFGLIISALIIVSLFRIRIDTNILTTLPKDDPVIADADFAIAHHPFQNQVVIDLSCQQNNIDILVSGGELIESALANSGLFQTVGMKDMQHLFPELLNHIVNNLPVLFTAEELETQVKPLLENGNLNQRIKDNLSQLFTMEGIGQGRDILSDPLGLRGLVLQKLKQLLPAENVHFYKGHLLSSDRKHLLIIANPKSASIDSKLSHKIASLIDQINTKLRQKFKKSGYRSTITPVGAYRAALDNETAAKKDINRSTLFATLGIALLLIFSFPRPLIGLLAFLPAVFGTLCSLAFYSLWHKSISIMTIGFGSAIISFTIDYGLSYLLFLDRPYETSGHEVDKEVRAVGLLAVLTSFGAFLTLTISGFPILLQIGQFSAFGILFSFLFVHIFFPIMFPTMRPAKSERILPFQAMVNKIYISGGKYKIVLGLGFAALMVFFARPEFKVDLASMNTVTKKTIEAENLISTIWGNRIFDKVYMLVETNSLAHLRYKCDKLTGQMEKEIAAKKLSDAFLPSMIFPGATRCKENLDAWNQFWNSKRKTALHRALTDTTSALGFTADTFSNTYAAGDNCGSDQMVIPKQFYQQLGIYHSPKENEWTLFASFTPGPLYQAERFFSRYHDDKNIHLFDPAFFLKQLAHFLKKIFFKMVLIIGLGTMFICAMFFFDVTLTLVALLPILFSMICTLGVLHLIGHPLNIAGLMLSVIVIGMGSDYPLYLISSYQRYRSESHPFQDHIRMTIFLAATSTLIGFGSLSMGGHNMMKSLGLFLVLGIGFALIGTFTLLPPILNYLFKPAVLPETDISPNSSAHIKRIRRLYRHLDAYPRLFARFKIKLDPMFNEIEKYLGRPNILMDLGCGFGVPAAWIRSLYPHVTIYGIDPDKERVRVASLVIGTNGKIDKDGAPILPDFSGRADTALMLDMIHYLNDDELNETLDKVSMKLDKRGKLIIRVTVPKREKASFYRKIEEFRLKAAETEYYFRSVAKIERMLTTKGFMIKTVEPSGVNREETWIISEIN